MFKQQETINDWLNGKAQGHNVDGSLNKAVRKYLINKAGNKCEQCGWNKENPVTHSVPLEIHHIDGNCYNSSIENLQVLCPNCHSLTPNFRVLNKKSKRDKSKKQKAVCIDCGTEICKGSQRCIKCNAKHRVTQKPVTKEELKDLLRNNSFLKISRMFGVSDRSIRKWCKQYGLPLKRKEINEMTDKDWSKL